MLPDLDLQGDSTQPAWRVEPEQELCPTKDIVSPEINGQALTSTPFPESKQPEKGVGRGAGQGRSDTERISKGLV